MNKKVRTALIFAAAMVILGFGISCVAAGGGAGLKQLFDEGAFNIGPGAFTRIGSEYGGDSGFQICRGTESFPAEQIEELNIGWISGRVDLRVYDGEELKVAESGRTQLKEKEKLRYKLEDGVLTIRFCSLDARDVQSKELTVLIPKGMALSKLTVLTVSADTYAEGLEVMGEAGFTAVSGGIKTVDLTAGRLGLEAVSGNISAGGSADSVRANSVSGDVELYLTVCPHSLDVETVSGDVELSLPSDSMFTLDFDTVSGDCENEIGTRGKADNSINIETVSGDLTIEEN